VSDPEREQLEAEILRLRATVDAQAALIAELRSRLCLSVLSVCLSVKPTDGCSRNWASHCHESLRGPVVGALEHLFLIVRRAILELRARPVAPLSPPDPVLGGPSAHPGGWRMAPGLGA